MTLATVAKLIAFALYLGMMVYVGFRSVKKNNSSSDFFLGGRKVGPWVTALSAEASDSSAWLLMGLPGLCYLGGFRETFWTAIGLLAGTYLAWLFIAKPLRKCSITFGDSITIPEFLTNRFKDKTHLLSVISVIFIVFFFTIYTASGLVACAKLFESVFGLNYYAGLVIGLIVILSYTILGGYIAVCTTDFIQGTLIFVAFIISAVIAIISLGGFSDSVESVKTFMVRAQSGEFGEVLKSKFLANKYYSGVFIVSALAWGLGYFGMPHIIVRFMGIRSNAEIKKARRIGISWMLIAYIGTFIIGTLGTSYLYKHGIILGDAVAGFATGDAETVFSVTMSKMYPAFIAGIFLCAILAASMSTADSQLLVASSAFSRDIFKNILCKKASEKTVLNVSRLTVLVIAAVGFILALNPKSSIFNLVSYAWAGFGATFGPLILLALFWKGITNKGAIAGLLLGGITVVVWHGISPDVHWIFGIYEIIPGFILNLAAAVIVSLLDKNKNPEVIAEFERYKALDD
ncbi:sodium/proline symporter PutP [Treponema sp.]|uniref:sodium/proline symporter PutP n=1 Tax=Treponema sp. TaxID=166 RepID=UPI0025CC09D6|nr:sodium/proline symporter PutP [Treponema sp.]MCR5217610.1 sodium/proline symporter PutP [Treponema sp.]